MAAKRLSPFFGITSALFAATAAWLTGGALTLTSTQADAPRIGILPSPVWLAGGLAVAFVMRAAFGSKGNRFVLLSLPVVLVAPWIPVSIPSAFYIWTGPLRGWLWAVVIAGPRRPGRRPTGAGLAGSHRARPATGAVAGGRRGGDRGPIAAYQVFPRLPTGDEPHYLVIAQSVLADRDLKIENNHRRGDYREDHAAISGPMTARGVNGEIYSVHAPGLPFMVAPVFALLGYPGGGLPALLSAWATALAWTAAWRVTSDIAASWFGWATVALTAPFVFQSFVVYPDAAGAALIMAGVLALTGGPAISNTRLVATGAALAWLPWLHTRYVAAAVMLGAMILARQWAAGGTARAEITRRAAALLSIPAISAACWFGFFYQIYGSPDPRGPVRGRHAERDRQPAARGYRPAVRSAIRRAACRARAVVRAGRAGRPGSATAQAGRGAAHLIAPYGLVVGAYQMWWGGNSSPGRFVIPVLLPMAIPAAVWFQTRRGNTGRLLGLGALSVSVLTTVTLAAVDRGILLYNFRDGASRLLTWLSPLVNITTGLPSVFQTTPSAALFHALVWIAAIALTAAIGLLVERRGATRTSVAVALGFSAVVSASVALTIVWRDHGPASAHVTPATGAMAFLQRYDPDSGQFAVRDRAPRRVRMRDVLANITLVEDVADPALQKEPAAALFRLPAGAYAIETTGSAEQVALMATVDREFGPQWKWIAGGTSRQELRFPVPTRALAIETAGLASSWSDR